MTTTPCKAPFPWFGRKSIVAALVWKQFGNVPNYVEPFFGSGAVLLGRVNWETAKYETVNDKDCYIANFWRAIQKDPEEVARYADWPINEVDLYARHLWLVKQRETLRSNLESGPEWYDPKIAGWWVWGICQWLGSGWCVRDKPSRQLPHLNHDRGVYRKRDMSTWLETLAVRLRRVRVCCGDWIRVLSPAVTFLCANPTAIFLDPPYPQEERNPRLYQEDSPRLFDDVATWAIEHGDNSQLRIALCGYEGTFDMPKGWTEVAWKANGGYGNQNREGNDNRFRERVWFSPHCLKVQQLCMTI
mgnify:CR=1 FL=1